MATIDRGVSIPAGPRPASLGRVLRRSLLGISVDEASFTRRRFEPGVPETQHRLESAGRAFITGYRAALEDDHPESLGDRLRDVPSERRGFAYEGAAMGLTLLDLITPWRRDRLARYAAGSGRTHVYMVHVGAGWALARLGRPIPASGPVYPFGGAPPDPLLRWLVADGYGFHQGYFHPEHHLRDPRPPRGVQGYARRAFDQGLGRCLWFVECGDVGRVRRRISTFAEDRRPDLWSGIGLAATYAGGARLEHVEVLRDAAGPERPSLAQGAAFAAQARRRAENPVDHTDHACRVLCGMSAEQAARITDRCLEDLPPDGETPAYEVWRSRVRATFG
jgi:hypothetical protein